MSSPPMVGKDMKDGSPCPATLLPPGSSKGRERTSKERQDSRPESRDFDQGRGQGRSTSETRKECKKKKEDVERISESLRVRECLSECLFSTLCYQTLCMAFALFTHPAVFG